MRIHNLLGLVAAGVISAACGGGNDENNSPSAIVIVSGNNQSGTAGAALAQPITVRVNDKGGDPLRNVDVAFAVTAGGGNVQTDTVTTDNSGQAATTWTVGTVAGAANTATATVSGVSAPATFNATVAAGEITQVAIVAGDLQTGPLGAALPQAVVVEIKDAFDNPVQGVAVTWEPHLGSTVQNAGTTTNAQGQASATWTLGLTFNPLNPEYDVLALVGGLGAQARATSTLDGTTLSVLSGNNQSGASSSALSAPLSVRVRTATNQNVAGVPITWAVASGGGNVSVPTGATDVSGTASVNFTLGAAAGAQSVTAGNASTTPTSVTFNATSIVVAPSTISGTVTLSNALLSSSAGKVGALRGTGTVRSNGVQRPDMAFGSVNRVRNTRDQLRYVPGELIVKMKRSAIAAPSSLRAMADVATAQAVGNTIRSALSRHVVAGKLSVEGVSPVILMAKVKVDQSRIDSIAAALAADPAVEMVGGNAWARADGGPVRQGVIPNDPFYPVASWNYSMVDLPRAWATTTGSQNVIVAVLDNGAVFFHPSVGAAGANSTTGGGNYRNDGYDFVSVSNATLCAAQGGTVISNNADGNGYDPDPSIPDDRDPDANGNPCARSTLGAHGTHVAGTIGAVGNDGFAAVGVNWSVGIRPVRVLGIDGGSYFDIAQGVLYASGLPADNGAGGTVTAAVPARIINMSLGGGCPNPASDPLLAAVQAVTNPSRPNGGVLVVVSAGNDATSTPSCPANYNEVIAVGALAPSGHRTSYSNFGAHVDIAAPGGDFPAPGGTVPNQSIGTFGVLSSTCDFSPFPAACTPNHAFYVGTSMASPHVAGIAALLLAANSSLTPADLRARLLNFAAPIDPSEQIGVGIVNARNALTQTLEPAHQVLVRAVNAATGAVAGTAVAAGGGAFSIGGLPDGNYFVFAGEDDATDGFAGLPSRRYGANGGVSSPVSVAVSTTAGAFASFTVGFPVEEEPNDAVATANVLAVDGSVQGTLGPTDLTDVYKVVIPTAGTYTFETVGINGAFCGFAQEVDTVLELLDGNQSSLGVSVDIDPSNAVRNFCSRISQSLTAGTYYLRVTRDEVAAGVPSNGRYILQARSGS